MIDKVAVWGPVACAAMLIVLIIVSMRQYACYPWPDASRAEKLSCYDSTGSPNARWKLQTISEMTARSGMTAELLSGLAAISLICIHNTLNYIKHNNDLAQAWHVIDSTFVVGALGFVGLTVWNLRVESTVHTCFTSQTIMAIFIQATVLTWAGKFKQRHSLRVLAWGVLLISMLLYIILILAISAPHPGPLYFDAKYYYHAYPQVIFFVSYFLDLSLIASCCQQEYTNLDEKPHALNSGALKTDPLNTDALQHGKRLRL